MSITRPAEEGGSGAGGAEGHSGRRFANPKHAEMLEQVLTVAPHLKRDMN
jgi:hypothetical protein